MLSRMCLLNTYWAGVARHSNCHTLVSQEILEFGCSKWAVIGVNLYWGTPGVLEEYTERVDKTSGACTFFLITCTIKIHLAHTFKCTQKVWTSCAFSLHRSYLNNWYTFPTQFRCLLKVWGAPSRNSFG
jgi:hypothetical protein